MEEEIRVRTPRGREVIGLVESLLGGNKLRVVCQDNKVRICRIPGRFRKSKWIRPRDAVLVEPWTIQTERSGDIVWRYTPTEAGWLRRKGILKLEI